MSNEAAKIKTLDLFNTIVKKLNRVPTQQQFSKVRNKPRVLQTNIIKKNFGTWEDFIVAFATEYEDTAKAVKLELKEYFDMPRLSAQAMMAQLQKEQAELAEKEQFDASGNEVDDASEEDAKAAAMEAMRNATVGNS